MAGADLAPARALVYRDVPIRDRGEMLSLTDMWRAAGADPSRQPAEWMRSAQAADFIDHILAILGISQDGPPMMPGSRPGAVSVHRVDFRPMPGQQLNHDFRYAGAAAFLRYAAHFRPALPHLAGCSTVGGGSQGVQQLQRHVDG